MSVCLCVCVYVCMSVCLSVSVSIYVSVCVSVCTFESWPSEFMCMHVSVKQFVSTQGYYSFVLNDLRLKKKRESLIPLATHERRNGGGWMEGSYFCVHLSNPTGIYYQSCTCILIAVFIGSDLLRRRGLPIHSVLTPERRQEAEPCKCGYRV